MALTRIQTAALQSSITGSNITDGSIAAADLASGSVTPVKLSTGAPTWDTSGSVGIGGAPSSWNSFSGALQIAGATFAGLGANNTALGSNAYFNTNWKYYGTGSATLYQQVAGQHYWQVAGAGTAGNAVSFSNAMVLDASGNVSIVNISRTSSTNSTSIVLSDIVTGAQTNGVYKSIRSQSNGGASVSEIRFLETDGTNNNTGIAFATQSTAGQLTERMRVTPSGTVLVGTTSATGTLAGINGIVAGSFVTATGSFAGPPTGAWTTIGTLPGQGLYILHAYIGGYAAGPANWSNAFMISSTSGANPAYIWNLSGAGTGNINCQMTGNLGVQIYTGSGSGTTISWTLTRLA